MTDAQDGLEVYVMMGSQFSGKVLAAMDAYGIPHTVKFAHVLPSKRKLPSGGLLVPEVKVLGDNTVIKDSEKILHWLDENRGTAFFAKTAASDESVRASDGVLAGAVNYYNWVDPEGHTRSLRTRFAQALPAFLCCLKGLIVDVLVKGQRKKFRALAAERLGLSDAALDDEAHVRNVLLQELAHFQSLLERNGGPYLLGQGSPTAPDFSVYAQLERLVGTSGDGNVPAALPSLLEDRSLARLWAWHSHMRDLHPIRFKGKRGK